MPRFGRTGLKLRPTELRFDQEGCGKRPRPRTRFAAVCGAGFRAAERMVYLTSRFPLAGRTLEARQRCRGKQSGPEMVPGKLPSNPWSVDLERQQSQVRCPGGSVMHSNLHRNGCQPGGTNCLESTGNVLPRQSPNWAVHLVSPDVGQSWRAFC